jgi:hypothetical protein
MVSVTPQPRFTPQKAPSVPIVQEAGWAPEPVWTRRLEEKSFRLCRGSNLKAENVKSQDICQENRKSNYRRHEYKAEIVIADYTFCLFNDAANASL